MIKVKIKCVKIFFLFSNTKKYSVVMFASKKVPSRNILFHLGFFVEFVELDLKKVIFVYVCNNLFLLCCFERIYGSSDAEIGLEGVEKLLSWIDNS